MLGVQFVRAYNNIIARALSLFYWRVYELYSFTHFVLVLFTWFYKEWKDAWKPSEERTNVVNEYSEWVSEMKVVSEVNAQILLLRP